MSRSPKCATTVGVFSTHAAAERAVDELRSAGYRDDQIGMICKDHDGKVVKRDADGVAETKACEGATIGAVAGAAGGAAVGAGMLAGVIPVIGPVIALGTLATVLIGAGGGAAVGSVTGALVGWGIPEDDAKYYENVVKSGQHLVTVECGQGDDARDLLSRLGSQDRHSTAA